MNVILPTEHERDMANMMWVAIRAFLSCDDHAERAKRNGNEIILQNDDNGKRITIRLSNDWFDEVKE